MAGRLAFAMLTASLAVAALSAPLVGMTGHATAYLLLHSLFSRVCHQELQRSFMMGGFAFPVCARCLGIYVGAAAGALLSLHRRWRVHVPAPVLWGAVALNGMDVAAEMLQVHGNLPVVRLLLGLGFGLAAALVVTGGIGGRHSQAGISVGGMLHCPPAE